MSIQSITMAPTGLVGVLPQIIYINTTSTYAEITATGFLNGAKEQGYNFSNNQMALVTTSDSGVMFMEVAVTTTNVSLVPAVSPGTVVTPTVANRIAHATDTLGTLSTDAATIYNAGPIHAGISGTSGYFASFPATPARGSFRFTAVANTGDTLTTLSNVAMGQASVISIPDPANALGRLLIGATATPFTSGNLPVASGTGGLMVDSGLAAANVQDKTNIKAGVTADIGGAGAGPISVVVAGLTAASFVFPVIKSSSNDVAVAKCIATATGFDITFTADPGAACVVNYCAFVAAQ